MHEVQAALVVAEILRIEVAGTLTNPHLDHFAQIRSGGAE
jgi:hypothetical protein